MTKLPSTFYTIFTPIEFVLQSHGKHTRDTLEAITFSSVYYRSRIAEWRKSVETTSGERDRQTGRLIERTCGALPLQIVARRRDPMNHRFPFINCYDFSLWSRFSVSFAAIWMLSDRAPTCETSTKSTSAPMIKFIVAEIMRLHSITDRTTTVSIAHESSSSCTMAGRRAHNTTQRRSPKWLSTLRMCKFDWPLL